MSYLDFYGLSAEPFSNAPVSRFYFNAPQHQQALTRLLYSVSSMKGLAVLVGEIGAGKTTLARRMLDSLPEEEYEAALLVIIHSGITASWILRRIALQLGVENPAQEKLALLSQLYQRLLQINEQGRKAVVLIDEAQMLETRELMEEFRGLLNLELPERKLISFVFFGLPEIEKNLKLDPPLAQRVAMRYRLEPFNAESTEAYVKHRMRLAGSARPVFTSEAMHAVHRRAAGTPRVINTLCDNALFEAFLARSQEIRAPLIEQIADNLGLEAGPTAPPAPAPAPAAPVRASPELPPSVRRDPELASATSGGRLPEALSEAPAPSAREPQAPAMASPPLARPAAARPPTGLTPPASGGATGARAPAGAPASAPLSGASPVGVSGAVPGPSRAGAAAPRELSAAAAASPAAVATRPAASVAAPPARESAQRSPRDSAAGGGGPVREATPAGSQARGVAPVSPQREAVAGAGRAGAGAPTRDAAPEAGAGWETAPTGGADEAVASGEGSPAQAEGPAGLDVAPASAAEPEMQVAPASAARHDAVAGWGRDAALATVVAAAGDEAPPPFIDAVLEGVVEDVVVEPPLPSHEVLLSPPPPPDVERAATADAPPPLEVAPQGDGPGAGAGTGLPRAKAGVDLAEIDRYLEGLGKL